VQAIRDAIPGVMFAWEAGLRFGRDPECHAVAPPVPPPHDLAMAVGRPEDEAHAAAGFTKLLVRHPQMAEDEITERVAAAVGDLALVTSAGAPVAELSAPGVHKASALERLCAEQGVAADEVVAFGDGPNDLPMLQWAGRGIAMANAHPSVLAAVDEVTESNEDDGVAVVLEQLLAERR
jgi:hydroxymethylpyrimidine pyrophosphatase-like HAD family hydrolase